MRIFGVILAGGAGRRMGGADKARLRFGTQTLLENAIDRLHPQVEALAISHNGGADPLTCEFAVLPDIAPLGPLAGILTALNWAADLGADCVVTVAVDTPFFPCDLAARLYLAAGDTQRLTIAQSARTHPTFGLWPVDLRGDLAAFLASGANPKVMDFCAQHRAVLAQFPDETVFANINTPADLAAAEALL